MAVPSSQSDTSPPSEPIGQRPLRVLYSICESHPTWRADVRVLFGKFMKPSGVQADLVATTSGESTPWPSGQVIGLSTSDAGMRKMVGTLLLQLKLLRLCRRGYDVLVVRDLPILSVIGLIAARLAGIPFAYWMSFPLAEANVKMSRERVDLTWSRRLYLRARGSLGILMLYRVILPRSDWIFAQSEVMIQELGQKGITHSRLSAVPMGVDIEELAARVATPPAELIGRRIAVYLGTLDRYRKPEIMIDIALAVAREFPDFTLLVIGDADEPSDRGWLEREAAVRGADGHMYFTGRIPFERAQALTQLAEVGLSPFPRGELLESASPTKAVEYLAVGLPVVCNDQPDQARLIKESGGGWCVPLEPQAFADAIIECLRDPARSRQMAERGRDYVGRYRSYRRLAADVATQLRVISSAKPVPRES